MTRAPLLHTTSPARLRTEVRGLFGDEVRAEAIERALRATSDVLEVRASAETGRVLVTLRRSDSGVRERVLAALARQQDAAAAPPPSVRRCIRAASTVARDAVRALRTLVVTRDSEGTASAPAADSDGWHAREPTEVASALAVEADRGLSSAEARSRRQQWGANVLAGIAPRTPAEMLAGQVLNVPVGLLTGAIAVSCLLGDFLEAGAIGLVLVSNIAIGYFTESRAEELLHAWGSLRAEWARVLRDGREGVVRATELVPGDVLVLRPGDAIAADARVLRSNDLSVDESTLTGESEAAEKSPTPSPLDAPLAERSSMLYTGTSVAEGDATAVVVATGSNTQLGALQRALSTADARSAPLERQLAVLGKRLAGISLGSAAVVVVVSLVRGRPLIAIARSAVALSVAAIPEGLPAAGTTALALASRRLLDRGIIIRRLAAAETLGAVSVICADKTGTLTQNRMRVGELWVPEIGLIVVRWRPGREARPDMELLAESGEHVDPQRLYDLARIAALNSDVEVREGGEIVNGSGTERALAGLAVAIGYPIARRRRSVRRIGETRRAPYRPFMVTVHEHPTLGRIELVKGAPEEVLLRCDLNEAERDRLLAENDRMASRGQRVLALAWRHPGSNGSFELAGLVAMKDPIRDGVGHVLRQLGSAGIATVMLTGDQHATARAIAREVGIPAGRVHSRVTPGAKLEIVRGLQGEGHVVAMTGDGVNDGPALKAADVGIAMGERGTDIARAVADVVLAHDDLGAIASAVQEGRRLYDNIRRAADYLIATNLSEIIVSLLGSVFAEPLLDPLQLLWLNILTDVAPALALTFEPADEQVMRRPPRDATVPLMGRDDLRRLGEEAATMAAASLGAYALGRVRAGPERAAPMAFLSLVVAQVLHARVHRASGPESNPTLAWVLGATAAAQGLALVTPGLRSALRTTDLGGGAVAAALLAGALPALVRNASAIVGEPPDAIVVVRSEARASDRDAARPLLREAGAATHGAQKIVRGDRRAAARRRTPSKDRRRS